jgi:uncharacterized protein (UPF0210 family)
MKYFRISPLALLCAATLAAILPVGSAEKQPSKPKIRAITAFVRVTRPHFQEQIRETLAFLRQAKAACEKAGYEVQTIRITTQPFPDYTRDLAPDEATAFFKDYNALAVKEGFDAAIGPAMMSDADDAAQADRLAKIIAATTTLEGSLTIAGEDGVHWKSLHAAAGVIQYLSEHTAHSQGNFNFAATAKVPSGTPFYPASYHTGPGHQFAIGLQSANVVAEALSSTHDPAAAEQALILSLGAHARAIESAGREIAKNTGWDYEGLDLSPAPLKDVSIGAAIESFTGARMGSSGTLTAAALVTRALRSIPITRTGYSGLMLPILEDSVLSRRWTEGALTVDSLLAYSAVCGTGLDVVPLPGDITQEQLERILGDVATLAVKLNKPLSARLLPVAGKKAGDRTEFDDPFLVNATLQPLP